MNTGDEMRRWRDEAGLRREDVAAALNVSMSTVYGWERGADPRASQLAALADLCGIDEAECMALARELES